MIFWSKPDVQMKQKHKSSNFTSLTVLACIWQIGFHAVMDRVELGHWFFILLIENTSWVGSIKIGIRSSWVPKKLDLHPTLVYVPDRQTDGEYPP